MHFWDRECNGNLSPIHTGVFSFFLDDFRPTLQVFLIEEEIDLVVGAVFAVNLSTEEYSRVTTDRVAIPCGFNDAGYDIVFYVHGVPFLETQVACSDL